MLMFSSWQAARPSAARARRPSAARAGAEERGGNRVDIERSPASGAEDGGCGSWGGHPSERPKHLSVKGLGHRRAQPGATDVVADDADRLRALEGHQARRRALRLPDVAALDV